MTDTGAGLSSADKEKLFLPYSQIRAGELHRGGGTGLGLCISKMFVEAHWGGRVGVESGGPGAIASPPTNRRRRSPTKTFAPSPPRLPDAVVSPPAFQQNALPEPDETPAGLPTQMLDQVRVHAADFDCLVVDDIWIEELQKQRDQANLERGEACLKLVPLPVDLSEDGDYAAGGAGAYIVSSSGCMDHSDSKAWAICRRGGKAETHPSSAQKMIKDLDRWIQATQSQVLALVDAHEPDFIRVSENVSGLKCEVQSIFEGLQHIQQALNAKEGQGSEVLKLKASLEDRQRLQAEADTLATLARFLKAICSVDELFSSFDAHFRSWDFCNAADDLLDIRRSLGELSAARMSEEPPLILNLKGEFLSRHAILLERLDSIFVRMFAFERGVLRVTPEVLPLKSEIAVENSPQGIPSRQHLGMGSIQTKNSFGTGKLWVAFKALGLLNVKLGALAKGIARNCLAPLAHAGTEAASAAAAASAASGSVSSGGKRSRDKSKAKGGASSGARKGEETSPNLIRICADVDRTQQPPSSSASPSAAAPRSELLTWRLRVVRGDRERRADENSGGRANRREGAEEKENDRDREGGGNQIVPGGNSTVAQAHVQESLVSLFAFLRDAVQRGLEGSFAFEKLGRCLWPAVVECLSRKMDVLPEALGVLVDLETSAKSLGFIGRACNSLSEAASQSAEQLRERRAQELLAESRSLVLSGDSRVVFVSDETEFGSISALTREHGGPREEEEAGAVTAEFRGLADRLSLSADGLTEEAHRGRRAQQAQAHGGKEEREGTGAATAASLRERATRLRNLTIGDDEGFFLLAACGVSRPVHRLCELMVEAMEGARQAAKKDKLTSARQLIMLTRQIAQLFVLLRVPAREAALRRDPRVAALFFSECSLIAHHLTSLPYSCLKSPELLERFGSFADSVLQIRRLQESHFCEAVVHMKDRILSPLESPPLEFSSIASDSAFSRTEARLAEATGHLQDVSTAVTRVLPIRVHLEVLGFLADAALLVVEDAVFALAEGQAGGAGGRNEEGGGLGGKAPLGVLSMLGKVQQAAGGAGAGWGGGGRQGGARKRGTQQLRAESLQALGHILLSIDGRLRPLLDAHHRAARDGRSRREKAAKAEERRAVEGSGGKGATLGGSASHSADSLSCWEDDEALGPLADAAIAWEREALRSPLLSSVMNQWERFQILKEFFHKDFVTMLERRIALKRLFSMDELRSLLTMKPPFGLTVEEGLGEVVI
uniref:Histidine kinase domain-containing protein n=1 Tax=Chromera velia CCMP2878 TaxID=1169474 RepID=A0A0G4H8N4_9ALVE|eukprot:Cvel_862.t1-p1 / transcript=Cvel_862.t1 / gene=Cvel_862 / organism=Chromera_velia_CCMP2878 / gene_product=hypothetical protein / transcript_product=hypothetical protein / location=Cvel_scaffold27:31405-51052(-) / protein_length=1235 / sequence_SO=supercontig / SO=protein_coding / is_pseudo=false